MAKTKPAPNVKQRKVKFSLASAGAGQVSLLGDFNSWDPKAHPMKSNGNGLWARSVMIPPGKYEYKFLVDGNWIEDPGNVETCPNCFGTLNSLLNID